MLFPGSAAPAKADGIVTACTGNQSYKIKKAGSHGPVLRTCLGRLIRSTYCPAFVRSRGQTPNAAKAGGIVTPCAVNQRFKIKKAGSHLLSRFRSIIGAEVLDFRVRNGNGYCHLAMATGIYYYAFALGIRAHSRAPQGSFRTVSSWNTSFFLQGEAVIWPSLSDY